MNRTLLASTALCALTFIPHAALACGGFFCSSAPIDQAGETIVYGLESDGTLTMAIQIRYSGNDDDFAWILPVPAPPQISIGSDALFDELRRTTQPTFVTEDVTVGSCRAHPRCVSSSGCSEVRESGCGGGGPVMTDPWTGGFVDAGTASYADGAASSDAAGPDPGVTIFSEGPIGPYDTVVLGAATAAEVVTWLGDHGYDIPGTSIPLLESYAAAGQVFVALRLRSNLETRIIRPVVLRMSTDEACLPIRLTAIATVPDMPITAFFLGRERVIPINYSTAMIDTSDPAFWTGRRTWASAVSEQVDRLDGKAFATAYAGPTPAIELELAEVADLATLSDAALYVQALARRQYRGDSRLLEIFESYIEPPADWAEDARGYYNCLASSSTVDCGEPAAFDPVRLTARITSDITIPRREAEALIRRHGYLTRLYTTMDAADMTTDPIFVEDAGLGDQDNVYVANRVTSCSADHYREDAPQHWLVDGVETRIRDGVPADDSGYCRALGGVLPSEAPTCSSSSSDGGWLCMVGGTAPIQGGVVFGIGLLLAARRLRRRRGSMRAS